jgi:hypothetical protein
MDIYFSQIEVGLEKAENPDTCHQEVSNGKRVQRSRRPKKWRKEPNMSTELINKVFL